MERRHFCEAVGAAVVGLGVWRSAPGTGSQRATSIGHWSWVHGQRDVTVNQWRQRFARLRDAGIQGVLVSGRDRQPAEAARAEGLEFHRWIWTLNRSGDQWVKEHHPEWFTVSRNGASSLEKPPYVEYYQWLCPTRLPVRDYLKEKVGQIARDSAVDGVHLDYVRHSDVILPIGLWSRYGLVQDQEYPEFDFCYCDVCRETFAGQTGQDPAQLADPPRDPAWRRFRWDSVTGLVKVLAAEVRGHGKRITAAVFPTPTVARALVRQAWEEWPLDAFFPMVYHGFYNEDVSWIETATGEGVTALAGRSPVYSGLYLPQLSPAELYTAVRVAHLAGAAGVSLFESGGLTDEHLESLKRATIDQPPADPGTLESGLTETV